MKTKRRKPREKRPAEGDADAGTRERILASAAEVFAATGYAGARVDAIAERAGVNKAMLYYHVGGKRELYTAVLVGTLDRALASLRTAVADLPSPAAKLQAVIETLARLGAENPVFIPLVVSEVACGGKNLPDEMVVRMSGVFRFVAEILEEGVRRGAFQRVDPLLTHVMLVGSVMFCIASQPVRQRVSRLVGLPMPHHAPTELAAHVGGLFLTGLQLPAGAAPRARRRSR